MRVMMLPRYGPLGASSRVRMWQYVPWVEAAGLDVAVHALLPDRYVEDLQAGQRRPAALAAAYARQVATVAASRRADVLWIEKEVLPWLPGWLERGLIPQSVPVVLDYDDAVYHLYEQHRSPFVRSILACKHERAMRCAALVTAGNPTLAERAERAGAQSVRIVPTVVDLDDYPMVAGRSPDGPPQVCWIGQRSTAEFLVPYRELFASLAAQDLMRFTAIGIDATRLGLPMASVPWSQPSEAAAIARCDIGIMPLADGPFERAKCGYKLIQYMACGLPVIASPVGVNRDIVAHGVNGFLAETQDEWRQALTRLAADRGLRERMGAAGRESVERLYSLQRAGPLVAELLRAVAERRSAGTGASLS